MVAEALAADKKKAFALGAFLIFWDESGFLLVPAITRTWAPRGETPVIRTAGNWQKVSALSALIVSPKARRLRLICRFVRGKNVTAPVVIAFLKRLLRLLPGQIVLLWDCGNPHRAALAQAFLAKHKRLHVEYFPAYAPELNPDEYVWTFLKAALANCLAEDTRQLVQLLTAPLRRLQRSQRLLWSRIHISKLPWRTKRIQNY